MLSMCGFICRFVRGWRQSEAANVMIHVASLEDESIVTERVVPTDDDHSERFGWCQPMCQSPTRRKQLLWRENNIQSSIVFPKDTIKLTDWKDFAFCSGLNENETVGMEINAQDNVTVLVEAAYIDYHRCSYDFQNMLMVSELSKPYAWKEKDYYGILIKTTPNKLVLIIQAFFNNTLLLEENLNIYKISTVNTTDVPLSTKLENYSHSYASQISWERSKKILHNIWKSQRDSYEDISIPPVSPPIRPSNWNTSSNLPFHSIVHTPKSRSQFTKEGIQYKLQAPMIPRGWAYCGNPSVLTSGPVFGMYAVSRQPSTHCDPILNSIRPKIGSVSRKRKRFPPPPISPIDELGFFTNPKPRVSFGEELPTKPVSNAPLSPVASFLLGRPTYRSPLLENLQNSTPVFLKKILSDDSDLSSNLQQLPRLNCQDAQEAAVTNAMIKNNLSNIVENYLTKPAKIHRPKKKDAIPLMYKSLDESNSDKEDILQSDSKAQIVLDEDMLIVSMQKKRDDKTHSNESEAVENRSPDSDTTDFSFSEDSLNNSTTIECKTNIEYENNQPDISGLKNLSKEDQELLNKKTRASMDSPAPSFQSDRSSDSFDAFSDDSLVSSNLEDCRPHSTSSFNSQNIELRSLASTPEEFAPISEECSFPRHWFDEYEQIFSAINRAQFSSYRNHTNSGSSLEPITEYDNFSKSSSSTYEANDIPYSRYNTNFSHQPPHIEENLCSDEQPDDSLVHERLLSSTNSPDEYCGACAVVNSVVERISSSSFSNDLDKNDFLLYAQPKSLLSPVDSITESGFASLKDSSNSDTNLEFIAGLPTSKSRDSLDMTEEAKSMRDLGESWPLKMLYDSNESSAKKETAGKSYNYLVAETGFHTEKENSSPTDSSPSQVSCKFISHTQNLFGDSQINDCLMASSPAEPTGMSNEEETSYGVGHSSTGISNEIARTICHPAVNTSNSSSSDTQDQISLKSQESLESFTHFNNVRANPKPRSGPKKKILSVDLNSEKVDSSGSPNVSSSDFSTSHLMKKSRFRKKAKDPEAKSTTENPKKVVPDNLEKKSALKSLKGLLKLKTKDPDKTNSPSVFKKFEIRGRSISKKDICHSSNESVGSCSKNNDEVISSSTSSSKTVSAHSENSTGIKLSRPLNKTSTKMGIQNLFSNRKSGSETNDKNKPRSLLKKSGHESPKLYRKVLMKNLSSSQESVENDNLHDMETSERNPSGALLGTRALKKEKKSISITIGFKPLVEESSKTLSEGTNLNLMSRRCSSPVSQESSVKSGSALSRKCSSMEILVCGKIKEHGRRWKQSSKSREGSFRLHREISVETLFEVPEISPLTSRKPGESYQEYLNRIQTAQSSQQSSLWSLNESSCSSHMPDDNQHPSLTKKYSLPRNIRLGDNSYCSNPNITKGNLFERGLPLSCTSNPAKKIYSFSANTSPVKRFHSGWKTSSSAHESCPASPLFEEEEIGFSGTSAPKPPNILVYTNNNVPYYEDVKKTLQETVNVDKYVIYQLTNEMAMNAPWASNTSLLVVCGDVPAHISTFFVRFLLQGGRSLSVCSDFLNIAVPLFAFKLQWTSNLVNAGTMEVQEASVISVTYGKWKNVQLLHHQHCLHSSPKKQNGLDLTKYQTQAGNSAVSVEPTSVEITDEYGSHHTLQMKVLATDDTWGAPALLLGDVDNGIGKAVFSQVHLEKNPQQGITEHLQSFHLTESNKFRIQILKDVLSKYLDIDTNEINKPDIQYTRGYLLGSPETKNKLIAHLKNHSVNGLIKRTNITLRFTRKDSNYIATDSFTPIIEDEVPKHFSTVKYFEALKTKYIGRLVIYSDVLTSGMHIINGSPPLVNGTAIICQIQTKGKGRSGNEWINPMGCIPICLQIQLPRTSLLAQRLPFVQHLVGIAICKSVLYHYDFVPMRLKWPNDIYLGDQHKIGGILVEASGGVQPVVSIGTGINLDNSLPTTCINDYIRKYNKTNHTNIRPYESEAFVANFFNFFEKIIDKFQNDELDTIYKDYYSLWLHSNAQVVIQNELKEQESAVITGVDEFGFLKAKLNSGDITSLHPDGNSFDMLQGLIYNKR